jgi:hypothetical protein
MLNKNLCKNCVPDWDKDDEENWNKGKVYCRVLAGDFDAQSPEDRLMSAIFGNCFLSTKVNAPRKCPYKLEHEVS